MIQVAVYPSISWLKFMRILTIKERFEFIITNLISILRIYTLSFWNLSFEKFNILWKLILAFPMIKHKTDIQIWLIVFLDVWNVTWSDTFFDESWVCKTAYLWILHRHPNTLYFLRHWWYDWACKFGHPWFWLWVSVWSWLWRFALGHTLFNDLNQVFKVIFFHFLCFDYVQNINCLVLILFN